MRQKLIEESKVEMTELVLPNDTNLLGNLLGGKLMHLIDIAGAMAASRHSNRTVTTAVIDSIDFMQPISMGELVILKAKLTWAGKTSMEVMVEVYSENIKEGTKRFINRSYLMFVALDEKGLPTPVPQLKLIDKDEENEFKKAELRKQARIIRKNG